MLIDGRSGAGKTSLTELLVAGWPGPQLLQVVALDSVYPGWDGLRAGADTVIDGVIAPHARGEVGLWRRWDWSSGRYAEEHRVEPDLPLVVEGVGILTPRSAELAHVRVWLEAPDGERQVRAIERDGPIYEPHWERWSIQEEDHLREHTPLSLATLIVPLP